MVKYIILSTMLISNSVIPANKVGKWEKSVDIELRQEYYKSCKQQKMKNCHYWSFEKSVVWKFN